jgi:RNA polymerase sigma-70 factor, ECF subfamily
MGRRPGRLLESERERSLRERLVARDERALAELVDVATPWLLNIARGMLHDEDEAEDVVTEAFRSLWENVAPVTAEESALVPYLLRVTRHRAIDRLRARERHGRGLSLVSAGAARSVPPVEPDEAGTPGWRVHQQVHAALDDLPADQRAVVDLAYFQGKTLAEVADELGIPIGTVKSRLHRAFGRLRDLLAGLQDWVV